jgi:Gpi18-like mannosyltransferase
LGSFEHMVYLMHDSFMHNKKFNTAAIALLYLFLVLFAHSTGGFKYDVECFTQWTLNIYKNGLRNTYAIFNNYMPFYQYVMYAFSMLAGSEENIVKNITYLKSVTILFDFVALWYVYRWIDKKVDYLIILIISMLNICFSYNSLIWGQVDGIHSALVFMSLYYAWQNRLVLSIVLFILALNMKLQAAIYAPVLGLICLYQLADKKEYKKLGTAIIAAVLVEACILFPFALQKEEGINLLWKQVTNSFSQFPWLGDCNFWSFVVPVNTWAVNDQGIFIFGLSYKTSGLILFSTSSLLVLWPLLRAVLLRLRGKKADLPPKEILWLMCAFIAVFFYFFNTEMHERYSHPALLFLTAYAFYSRNFVAYVVYCLAYFLVLEGGPRFLKLNNYDILLFNSLFRASMFALAIICMVFTYISAWRRHRLNAPDAIITKS